ncbi:MAG: TraB/GumN family protein [Rhodanobacter sp.]
MFKSYVASVLALILCCPAYGVAAQAQSTSAIPLPLATTTPASATSTQAPVSAKATPVTLAAIVVTAADTEPHIWTYQKGRSKILVLGTIYPEPKGLDFIPFSINSAISASGAVIGPPWFNFGVHVNLFNLVSVWRDSKDATRLPDGKHLADVVPATLMQRWKPLKAYYLPYNHKVEKMLPMYAGWKLYDAVLDRSGVAVKASIPKLIEREAGKHGMKVVDASFHWTVKDPSEAAHAFTPDPQADLACFKTILDGIQGLPGASRTMASAWASGDVATMRTFLQTHKLTPPCWQRLTDQALAKEQRLDLEQREREAWLTAVNTAAAQHSVIFTTASVQEIFAHTGRIGWLLGEGYTKPKMP